MANSKLPKLGDIISSFNGVAQQDLIESQQIDSVLNVLARNGRDSCWYVPPDKHGLLSALGIFVSPYAAEPHPHPVHKHIEENLLKNLRYRLTEACTLLFMKREKAERVRRYVNDPTIQLALVNFVYTAADVARYREILQTDLLTFEGLGTPTVFIHDAIHYFTPKDIQRLFDNNPGLHTIYATCVCPPEMANHPLNPSIHPDLYGIEYINGTDLFCYIPEGHADGTYIQDRARSLLWLQTFTVDGANSYEVHVLQSHYAQHLLMLTRHHYEQPPVRVFNYPHYTAIPTLYRADLLQLTQDYIPKAMYMALHSYARGVNCDKKSLVQIVRSQMQIQRYPLSPHLVDYLAESALHLSHARCTPAYYSYAATSFRQLVLSYTLYPIYNRTLGYLLDAPRRRTMHLLNGDTYQVTFRANPHRLRAHRTRALLLGGRSDSHALAQRLVLAQNNLGPTKYLFFRFSWHRFRSSQRLSCHHLRFPNTSPLTTFFGVELSGLVARPLSWLLAALTPGSFDRLLVFEAGSLMTGSLIYGFMRLFGYDPVTLDDSHPQATLLAPVTTDDNAETAKTGPVAGSDAPVEPVRSSTNPHGLESIPWRQTHPELVENVLNPPPTDIPYPARNDCLLGSIADCLGIERALVWRFLVLNLSEARAVEISTECPYLDANTHGVMIAQSMRFSLFVFTAPAQSADTACLYACHNAPRITLMHRNDHFTYFARYPGGATFNPLSLELNLNNLPRIAKGVYLVYRPSHERASKLINDIHCGRVGTLHEQVDNPAYWTNVKTLLLKAKKKSFLPHRSVKVLCLYGFAGSGKSYLPHLLLERYLHTDSPHKNSGKVTAVYPLLSLREAARLSLPTSFSSCLKTWEKVFYQSVNGTVIIDEIGKFPPGFLDVLLYHRSNIQTVIITGDILQSTFGFVSKEAESMFLEPEVDHMAKYATVYYMYTHRLPPAIAARHGISTTSTAPGDYLDSGMRILTDSALFPSIEEAHDTRANGQPTFTYSGSQGLTLAQTTVVLSAFTPLVNERTLLTALTRTTGTTYIANLMPHPLQVPEYLTELLEPGLGFAVRERYLEKITATMPQAKVILDPPSKDIASRLRSLHAGSILFAAAQPAATWNHGFVKNTALWVVQSHLACNAYSALALSARFGVEPLQILSLYRQYYVDQPNTSLQRGYCWLLKLHPDEWNGHMLAYPPALNVLLWSKVLKDKPETYVGQLMGDFSGPTHVALRHQYTSIEGFRLVSKLAKTLNYALLQEPSWLPTNRIKRFLGLPYDESQITNPIARYLNRRALVREFTVLANQITTEHTFSVPE